MILSARLAFGSIVAIGAVAAPSLGVVAPASAVTTTTINLQVTGCDGCVFVAHRPNGNMLGTSTAVNHGNASLVVATSRTSKMSFEVKHPLGYGAGNAVTFVVVKYDGFKAGQTVPPASAAKQKHGALCWAASCSTGCPKVASRGPQFNILAAHPSPGRFLHRAD